MIRRRLALAAMAAALASLVQGGPVTASNASCAGQFISSLAPVLTPFGRVVVVPEIQVPTLGGPNLGQEVKVFFATADRNDCPITPAP
jgi:hypothetical protein